MDIRRDGDRIQGRFSPEDSCKDNFKYRLVGENGRYRFASVTIDDVAGCEAGSLGRIVEWLKGKYLDEVDLRQIEALPCKHAQGCPREIARMIRELRQILLP